MSHMFRPSAVWWPQPQQIKELNTRSKFKLSLKRQMLAKYKSVTDPGFEVTGGGGAFLGNIIAPPPLRDFPEATIKVYTWIF